MCAMTHDVEVQKILPQVLLGNGRCFSTDFVRSAHELHPGLVVWREKSAWNNRKLMAKYLRLLCGKLGAIMESRQVYLLLDLAPCHLHDSLFDLACSLGLRLLYIPPGMTSYLQPCDTHLFSLFKFHLQENWRQKKSEAPDGKVTVIMWLDIVAKTIEFVSSKDWKHAFNSDGILSYQANVSQALLQKLALAEVPGIPSTLLEDAQSQLLFPANWRGNPAKYIQWNPHAVRTLE